MKGKTEKFLISPNKKIRKDWGSIKPYTRVEKDKSKYCRKDKYKKNYESW